MIAYLPEIYPDELVYSWFCRYFIHSGCLSHKAALQELLNKRCNNPSKEFIGQLNPEAKAQIERIYPMDKLVLEHTMYPQYARFISAEQKKTALTRLGYDFCDAHHLFAILPRSKQEQFLKFCPQCVREDRQQYGETYWHRKHQIRNIGICPKHGCTLEDSAVPAKSEQSFTLSPAEISVNNRPAVFVSDPLRIQFAAFMEKIFDAPMDFNSDVPLSAILYHGLKQTTYLKPSGRSRYTKRLTDDLTAYYRKIKLNEVATMSQIQRILLGDRFDFSVACQIAFYIGMNPDELTCSRLSTEEIQQEQSNHYMKNHQPINWTQYDEETAPKMERLCKRIYYGEIGRPERVGEKLVNRELGLLGHQLENMPRCRAIFDRYTESYPESWARKLIWAYKKLETEQNGIPFYWSDLRKLSGVKKKNFPEILPFLRVHTDFHTVEQIVQMVTDI